MNKMSTWLRLLVVALLVAGCANQKEPASKAVAEIDTSLADIRTEAEKFAPESLQQVDTSVAALKDSLNKGDYKAVLASAPSVSGQVSTLRQDVAAKKADMEAAASSAAAAATQQWQSLSADVPKMVAAVQSRVDILSKSRKLPKNVSADALQAAKDGLENMKGTWAEATTLFSSGDPSGAVAKAQAVRDKGMEVMQRLGMS